MIFTFIYILSLRRAIMLPKSLKIHPLKLNSKTRRRKFVMGNIIALSYHKGDHPPGSPSFVVHVCLPEQYSYKDNAGRELEINLIEYLFMDLS